MANRTVSVNLVANIGQYVSGMNAAAGATMRLGDTATASSKKAQSGFDLAGKGAMIMGAAVVGGLAMAVNASMNFEKAMSAAATATRASGSALGNLRDAAMKAGADTAYSATEAAGAITEMGKAGVSTADILDGGLKGALSLAAAGQLDVAKAAEIASVAMTQFKLSGDQLPHVADLLAAGAGKAMGSVEDLGMALNQAGLVASSTGLSIEETTGSLAAFASAGLVGSDAGTSLRSMLLHLQNATGPAAAEMEKYGISLYDAAGNFVGMEDLAGQLQTRLGGLTQETRDAAMAQIFGSDAVRAANVLYTEGSDGIADWTEKVNDAGYAAETAAKLQDNLAGDLEKLGGAFETLMISMGSGTQGPLRELVQIFTSLLDGIGILVGAFNSLPGPVGAALVVFGALAAFKGPLSGMFESVALKAMYLKDGMVGAVTSASGLKGALSGVAGAFTPMTIGITSATILLPALIESIKTLTGNSDSAAAGQQALADALRATNGVIDESSRKAAQQTLVSEGLVDVLDKAGVAGKDAIDGLLGNAAAQDRVNKGLQDYITETMRAQGPVNTNTAAVSEAQVKYQQLAESLGMSKQEAEFFADAAVGAAGATGTAGGAAEAGAGQMQKLADATAAAKDQVDAAKDAVDGFKLSLDILTGAHVSMIQVESAFEAAVAAADGAVKDMTGSVLNATGGLNMQSESGRAAADVLLDVRDSGNQLIATMIQQGASADQVRAKEAQLRESFILSAGQMGINRQAAEVLADQILGIPDKRNTVITADTRQAQGAIDGLVNSNSGRVIGLRVTATGDASVRINNAKNLATGGPVFGPGTGTSDSIPAMLSNGEFVVNAKATGYNRELLEAINSGHVAQFAAGGIATRVGIDTVGAQSSIDAFARTLASAFTAADAGGGPAGAGGIGGGWTSIFNYVKARIPQARANSTYRPGDPGYHGRGKAVDFGFGSGPGGAGSAGLASINRVLHDGIGRNLAELIYDGIGDDRPDLKNGRPLTYNAGTRAAHRNHVHAAVYDQGGILPHGGAAFNFSGSPERVLSPQQTREFSGGGGRAPIVVNVTPNLEGARITGQVAFDPAGVLRLTDARIDATFGDITDTVHYAGG